MTGTAVERPWRYEAGSSATPLSVVVLSRNEEGSIGKVLQGILRTVKPPLEVLVVDGSQDGTRRIVEKLAAGHPGLRLVPQRGVGYSAAFRTAVLSARGEALVFLVADGSDDAEDIEAMRALIDEGYDLVCASRYMKGGMRLRGNTFQGACSRLVCAALRAITGVGTHDVTSSFKMYRRSLLRQMAIEDAGFATSMQVTLKAHNGAWRIAEVPTTWRNRRAGSSKLAPAREAVNYASWSLWGIRERLHASLRPGKRRA